MITKISEEVLCGFIREHISEIICDMAVEEILCCILAGSLEGIVSDIIMDCIGEMVCDAAAEETGCCIARDAAASVVHGIIMERLGEMLGHMALAGVVSLFI